MSWKNPPPRPTGIGTSATFFKWVWDMLVHRVKPINTDTVKWDLTPRGLAANVLIPPISAAGGSIQELQLISVFGDYTVCRGFDGTLYGVAKPPDLRNYITSVTEIDNAAQTAVKYSMTYPHNPNGGGPASDPFSYVMRQSMSGADGTVEKQLIVPPYLLTGGIAPAYQGATASIILAIPGTTAVEPDPEDPSGVDITMIEVGPRAWTYAQDQAI